MAAGGQTVDGGAARLLRPSGWVPGRGRLARLSLLEHVVFEESDSEREEEEEAIVIR